MQEEEEDNSDEDDNQNNDPFYRSIAVELPDDQQLLDRKMRTYCSQLEYIVQTANPKLDLIMSRIRLNHPVFKLISASTVSFLIERSYLFKLMNSYGAYQEGYRSMNNIYFVLYGELHLSQKNAGQFGEPLSMGYTVGEEILFSEHDPVIRMENCVTNSYEGAALLQVNVDEFIKMSTSR